MINSRFIWNNSTQFVSFHEYINKLNNKNQLNSFINLLKDKKIYHKNIKKFFKIYKWIIVYYKCFICNRLNTIQPIVTLYINKFLSVDRLDKKKLYYDLFNKYLNKLIKYIYRFLLCNNNKYYLSEIKQIITPILLLEKHKLCQLSSYNKEIFHNTIKNITYSKCLKNVPMIYKDISVVRILVLIVKELSYTISMPIKVHEKLDNLLIDLHISTNRKFDIFSFYRNSLICSLVLQIDPSLMQHINKFHALMIFFKQSGSSILFLSKYIELTELLSNNVFIGQSQKYNNFKLLFPARVYESENSIVATNQLFAMSIEQLKHYFIIK